MRRVRRITFRFISEMLFHLLGCNPRQIRNWKNLLFLAALALLLFGYIVYLRMAIDNTLPVPVHKQDLEVTQFDMGVQELKDIQLTHMQVLMELNELNAEYVKLKRDVQMLNVSIGSLMEKEHIMNAHLKLKQVELEHIEQQISVLDQKRFDQTNPVPLPVLDMHFVIGQPSELCSVLGCFKMSLCNPNSFTFSVLVEQKELGHCFAVDSLMVKSLRASEYYVQNHSLACVVLVPLLLANSQCQSNVDATMVLTSLGAVNNSNMVILVSGNFWGAHLDALHRTKSLVVTFGNHSRAYRPLYDLILPSMNGSRPCDFVFPEPAIPPFREIILSFQGAFSLESFMWKSLQQFSASSVKRWSIKLECLGNSVELGSSLRMCGSFNDRMRLLRNSTTTLVFSESLLDCQVMLTMLLEALEAGAVPVVVDFGCPLPFHDVITWHNAVVMISPQHLAYMPTIVNALAEKDIVSMRLQGRFLWQTYFSCKQRTLEAILMYLQHAMRLQPMPKVLHPNSLPLYSVLNANSSEDKMHTAFPALCSLQQVNALWNRAPGPAFPLVSPFLDSPHVSSVPFHRTTLNFSPLARGMGGDGHVFSQYLGGNHPVENFTIVILSYNRRTSLFELLKSLKGTKHIGKIIVVWNNLGDKLDISTVPVTGAPLQVIYCIKNSLNNRFIPYPEITTDAVLSLDDDVVLEAEEIDFAFRVWRENRERIVGFPGRYHAWNSSAKRWEYGFAKSCELSMVLTGAAFIHKYYLYMYTLWMPSVVRSKVDEFMNCEDLAINFLISHLTRKTPIKVTSRWRFPCASCSEHLYSQNSHFLERSECVNFLEKVYGYMPLLKTQYRADSVLYRTYLTVHEKKCYSIV